MVKFNFACQNGVIAVVGSKAPFVGFIGFNLGIVRKYIALVV